MKIMNKINKIETVDEKGVRLSVSKAWMIAKINELIDAFNQGKEPEGVKEPLDKIVDGGSFRMYLNYDGMLVIKVFDDYKYLDKKEAQDLLFKITRLIDSMDPDF